MGMLRVIFNIEAGNYYSKSTFIMTVFGYYTFGCIDVFLHTQKLCSEHISTLLGAQGANPETPGQAPSLS